MILRQIDTKIPDHVTAAELSGVLTKQAENICHGKTLVPFIHSVKDSVREWQPLATAIGSYCYILNRAAVELLTDNFYQLAVNELVQYYNKLGTNNLVLGGPGTIMFKVAIKLDIDIVPIFKVALPPHECMIWQDHGQPARDSARLERMGL